MSTVTVNSTAALLSALASAHGGDVIQLAAGNYSGVALQNLNFSSAVTVTSAPGAQAVLLGMQVTSCSNLTFTNLAVDRTTVTDSFAARVTNSSNIVLDHMSIHGSLDGNPGDDNMGLYITGSTNVSVTNSEFQQLADGIAELNNNGVYIANNYFHDIVTDGIDNGGSSNVTITGNTFTNFDPSAASAHPDAIQFWTSNTTASASNIVISNNIINAGTGGQTQGIFIGDEAGYAYQNVTISGNTITGELANGVAVYDANNLTVSNNVVTSNANPNPLLNSSSSGYSTVSGINVYNSSTINLSGNNADGYLISGNTNLTQSQVNSLSGVAQTATIYSSVSATLGILSNTLVLTGTAAINGTANNLGSTLIANNAGDRLYDGSGNDTLVGGTGNDALISRSGSDTLTGGGGNNTFQINTGVVAEVITDFGSGGGDNLDISAFLNAGKTPILTAVGSDTVISFTGSTATITLKGVAPSQLAAYANGYMSYLTTPVYVSSNITLDQYHHAFVLQGTSSLNISANNTGSTIWANGAGDRIYDGNGADTLIGGAGGDTLISRGGSDTLFGGGGSDTFQFGNGIAHGVVGDFAAGDRVDISSFLGAGLTPTLTAVGNTTVISFAGSSATITLDNIQPGQLSTYSNGYSFNTAAAPPSSITPIAPPPIPTSGGTSGSTTTTSSSTTTSSVTTSASTTTPAPTTTLTSSTSATLPSGYTTLVLTGTLSLTGTANNTGSTIYANDAGDRLYDGTGNDTLIGGAGSDTLISRSGSDTLTGGGGNDTFQLSTGISHAVIADFGSGGVGDSLDISSFLSAGLTPTLTAVGGGTVISFSGSSATITVQGVAPSQLYATANGYISNFTAPVYSSVSATLDAFHHTLILQGTSSITGTANNMGSTVQANDAGDRLYDGAGNDTLIGGAGSDTLNSNGGSDTLTGGAGHDTFHIGTGIVQDVITDFGVGGVGDNLDISAFLAAGLKPTLTAVGSDTVISFSGSSDTITLKGVAPSQLLATANGYISNFTAPIFSSASASLDDYHHTLILQGTSIITGSANNTGSTIYANGAGDRLYDGAGNDTLIGGAGNDTLLSNAGNDTLTGGKGWNTFQIGTGVGHEVITDFELRGAHNSLNISAFLSSGHAASVADVGGNAVISFSGSSATITLLGAHAADLTATSFGYTH